ncbi:hypothetical protein [Colwellia echini]|uniref:Glycosyltransferase 2-like domain-containing protein n=1 Tax=Colwellia echini TaxID=1982103 RepID=A0ABY3MUB7_9GAMM|nr:hypothetical protein [Colwellia echini]TYK64721.1 hypothetical protein CWS31_014195 [Colwellia echini]
MKLEEKNKLSILIVLYNKSVFESKTLMALLNNKGLKQYVNNILIWDNSKAPLSSIELDKLSPLYGSNISIVYKHSKVNLPLSSVYNVFFDEYESKSSHLCILDDDSDISDGFFHAWSVMLKSNPKASLYLPNIFHHSILVSPTKRFFLKGFYFKDVQKGKYKNNNLSAINSGMIISTDYLRRYLFRYNEKLKAYGTDDFFMVNFQRNKKQNSNVYACILNYSFSHDLTLSTLNNDSIELQNRYGLLLDSWKIIYNERRVTVFVYSLIHSLYMSSRYCNLNYFKIFKERLFCNV